MKGKETTPTRKSAPKSNSFSLPSNIGRDREKYSNFKRSSLSSSKTAQIPTHFKTKTADRSKFSTSKSSSMKPNVASKNSSKISTSSDSTKPTLTKEDGSHKTILFESSTPISESPIKVSPESCSPIKPNSNQIQSKFETHLKQLINEINLIEERYQQQQELEEYVQDHHLEEQDEKCKDETSQRGHLILSVACLSEKLIKIAIFVFVYRTK